jgi:hypothetical protein
MSPDRFGHWPPHPLDYQSRLRLRRQPIAAPRRDLERSMTTVLRDTAGTVVILCLTVAVPCVVFTGVGLWFDDESAIDSAWTAVLCAAGAAVAAVPALMCHRRLALRRPRPSAAGQWN